MTPTTTRHCFKALILSVALTLAACGGSPLALNAPAPAAAPSSSSTATVPYTDQLLFAASSYSVAQTQGAVTLTVRRAGDATAAVTVEYATLDGTALVGTDYTSATGTLQWAENDATAKTITVSLKNTAPYSGNRTFSVALSNPVATAQIATPDVAEVTISGADSLAIGSPRFAASQYALAQVSQPMMISVNRANGSSGPLSVNYTTVNGSAVGGTDFTAVSGTLEWADGDATAKGFSLSIDSAQPFIGTKTLSVALSSPSTGAALGTPSNATLTIAGSGSAAPGTLHLSVSSYAVTQAAGAVSVAVERAGGINGPVSVSYITTKGTAIAGTDFTAAAGTLIWASGDSTPKTFSIPISAATPFTGNRGFSIALTSPANGATISSPGSASVTIAGTAAPAVGSLQLGASAYAVAQNAGSLVVSVARIGGAGGAVGLAYAAHSGTAVAGTDFTPTTGTLSWGDGDAAPKSFSIPINNAMPFAGARSFSITLSNPGGGAMLGTPATAIASITGDAPAAVGRVQLGASAYTVARSAGRLGVTVNRTGGSIGAISVAYQTIATSAVAGVDYTATVGTLDWPDGDASGKTVSVAILNTAVTASKSFSISLSNPSGGAALGNPGSALITITGAAPAGGPSAPSGLRMTDQGANRISLSWSAATPGSNPIAKYQIYRNELAYASTTSTSYTDEGAANATNGNYTAAAAVYSYTIAAIDNQGNEGPQSAQTTFDVYGAGVYNWASDYSYSASANYQDSSGQPQSGTYDIEVTVNGAYGGFQPYAGKAVPQWDMEAGSFGYLSIDLKPTRSGQAWRLSAISRLPPGDVYPWAAVNIGNYGPTPVAGQWATYKIPLSALSIGITHFQGSISGNTLTVTSVNGGVGVDAGGFISGSGVQPGTYIVGHNANGGPGTYTISPSQNVANTALTEQRTAVYKLDVADQSGVSWNQFYIDNLKFLVH